MRRPTHTTAVAYVALFLATTGTAAAATGSYLIAGRSNAATTTTYLSNSAGTPLGLSSKTGTAPLAVNSSTKVARLNSDLLDGLDSSALQRRVTGVCPAGKAVAAIAASGAVTCVALAPPAPQQPAQFVDKGWAISDLQLSADSLGDWTGRARITNQNATTKTGGFTVTLFRDGHVIAALRGSVSSAPAGSTYTVDFYTTDDWTTGDYTTTFQTDSSY